MKRLSLFVLAISLACGAAAQDLHSTSFVDQLNVGKRGNDEGTKVIVDDPNTTANEADATEWGPAKTDGSDFVEYNGADLTISGASTAVKYVNTWGTHGADLVESPIRDITVVSANPDRSTHNLARIWANDNPAATGGDKAIVIGDDGGYNALFFGESNDRNYYVEVDMFFPVATVGAGLEIGGLVARAARDDVDQADRADYSYSPHRDGSYGIIYEYQTNTLKTVTYLPNGGQSPVPTVHSTQAGQVEGWHTLRIECTGDTIKFFVDEAQIGSNLVDTTAAIGRPGIFYLEQGNLTPSANERQATFDRISAGPLVASDIGFWSLY